MDTSFECVDFTIAYLDEILIESKSTEHVNEVFEKIKQYGLKPNLDKCDFLKSKIKCLGQIINAKGRKSDSSKSSIKMNIHAPTIVSAQQAFLGLANYNCNFIPNMHVLRDPLTNNEKRFEIKLDDQMSEHF